MFVTPVKLGLFTGYRDCCEYFVYEYTHEHLAKISTFSSLLKKLKISYEIHTIRLKDIFFCDVADGLIYFYEK